MKPAPLPLQPATSYPAIVGVVLALSREDRILGPVAILVIFFLSVLCRRGRAQAKTDRERLLWWVLGYWLPALAVVALLHWRLS